MSIAIIGGTGPQGQGLAKRFAMAGLEVIIGSRNEDSAKKIANEFLKFMFAKFFSKSVLPIKVPRPKPYLEILA